MDLELATVDDIVHELKRRQVNFLLVTVSPSNRQGAELTCAYQGATPEGVRWMLQCMRQEVTGQLGGNGNWDGEAA
jgi:hypothetical protein